MSGDLIIRKLKDVIFEVIDNRGKNPESYSKYGIPVIDNFLINGNKSIDLNEVKRYITEDVYNGFLRKTLNAGDVLITLVGNGYGQVATSPEEKSCIIQNTIGLRTNDDNDNGFLFYLLKLNRKSIMDLNRGAAQPSVKAGDLLDLEFKFLSKANQIKVAKILGDLDDKITLNRQINQTLEAMAQALFKSWFVDFEPVKAKLSVLAAGGSADDANLAAMSAISGKTTEQLLTLKTTHLDQFQQLTTTADLFPSEMVDSELGEIPKGWEVKALGNYLTIKRGGSPRPIQDFMADKGYPWTKISDATATDNPYLFATKEYIKEDGLKKTVLLKKGSLILSNSATPGLPKFLELDACIHDGWLYFPEKTLFTDTYLYFLFLELRQHLVMQGNGSVFTNLKTDILKNQLVVAPESDLFDCFESVVGKQLSLIRSYSLVDPEQHMECQPFFVQGIWFLSKSFAVSR